MSLTSSDVDEKGEPHAQFFEWGKSPVNINTLTTFGKKTNTVPNAFALAPSAFAVVDTDGFLYTWGFGKSGQLGHDDTLDSIEPRIIDSLRDVVVKQVSLGSTHAACVTVTGCLYTWGDNSFGMLGLRDTTRRVKPQLVMALAPVKVATVSLGGKHSMCITEQFDLYSWGAGSYGRLGSASTVQVNEPQQVEIFRKKSNSITRVIENIGSIGSQDKYKVHSVSLSDHRSAITTHCGRLFICGRQYIVDSSIPGDIEDWLEFQEVDGEYGSAVFVQISNHCASIINSKGELFTYGKNICGMLGHGSMNKKDIAKPKCVQHLKHTIIEEVCIGTVHMAARTSGGKIYIWGSHPDVDTSHCIRQSSASISKSIIWKPICLQIRHNWQPIHIQAQSHHTAVLVNSVNLQSFPVIKVEPQEKIFGYIGMKLHINLEIEESDESTISSWLRNDCPEVGDKPIRNKNVLDSNKEINCNIKKDQQHVQNEIIIQVKNPPTDIHSFHVNEALESHSGSWKCIIKNKFGSVKSRTCQVLIISLEKWVDVSATLYEESRQVMISLHTRLTHLLGESKDRVIQEKFQAKQKLVAAFLSFQEADKARSEALVKVRKANKNAQQVTDEEKQQAAICYKLGTMTSKRDLAESARNVALSWENVLILEYNLKGIQSKYDGEKNTLKLSKESFSIATSHVDERIKLLEEAECLFQRSKITCQKRKQDMLNAKKMMQRAEEELRNASAIMNPKTVDKITEYFFSRKGWIESPTLSFTALNIILEVASMNNRFLCEVENSRAEELALSIATYFTSKDRNDDDEVLRRHAKKETSVGLKICHCAYELLSILSSALKMKKATANLDIDTLCNEMIHNGNVPSLLSRGIELLGGYNVALTIRSREISDLILQAIDTAQNCVNLVRTHKAILLAMHQMYEVVSWTIATGINSHTSQLLKTHFISLTRIKKSLSPELMCDWGWSISEIENTLRGIETINQE